MSSLPPFLLILTATYAGHCVYWYSVPKGAGSVVWLAGEGVGPADEGVGPVSEEAGPAPDELCHSSMSSYTGARLPGRL